MKEVFKLKKKISLLSFLLSLFIFGHEARALSPFIARSFEGLLMGDAYTAVADDEMTLFYNPAALIRHRGLTIVPLKGNFQFPDIVEKDIGFDGVKFDIDRRFRNWPSNPEGVVQRVLGYPIYLEGGISPTLKLGNFAMNIFAISKTQMALQNAVHPVLDVGYRYDRGFIMGYAFTLTGKKNLRQRDVGHRMAFGLSLKSMNRQRLKGRFDLFGTELLEILADSGNFQSIRERLGYVKGKGGGVDMGLEYSYANRGNMSTLGLSWFDVGGTQFRTQEGQGSLPIQRATLNLGSAFSQDWGFWDYTLSADYHNILSSKKFSFTQLHLGSRLRLPLFNFYLGHHGGYASWGLGFNFLSVELKLGFYGTELGSSYRQEKGRRAIISLGLGKISWNKLGL